MTTVRLRRMSFVALMWLIGTVGQPVVGEDTANRELVERAIRELVRRGAVVKRFEVKEIETAGLLVRLKAEHLDSRGCLDPLMTNDLAKLEQLAVEFRGVPLSDDGLAALLTNVDPIGLDLAGSKVTDVGLKSLQKTRSLRMLDLSFTRVSDASMKPITGQTGLRHLSLIECRIGDKTVDQLSSLIHLRKLFLKNSEATSDSIMRLKQQLPKCQIMR